MNKRTIPTLMLFALGEAVAIVLLIAFLSGCAVRKQRISATPVVIIPRECITKVELTPDSECYLSKDGNLTLCRHVNITRKERCEMLKANP